MAGEIKITIGGDASGIQKAAQQANTALQSLRPGANQASNALTNLGRVAQDAPFGFIGIQNNLNPLLESFERLKAETGSTGGALKALGASLMGPAGIGFALSAVSGLVTVAIQKYGSLGNALSALFTSTSATTEATRALGNAFSEAQGKAAGEIAVVNALVATARSEELSKNARLEAINKLNKEYDQYLPKLSLENINTQQVTDSVEKLNASLIRQAKIRGVQDLISKETQKQAEAYSELIDQVERGDKGFNRIINMLKSPLAPGAGISAEIFRIGKGFEESEARVKVFNDVLKRLIGDEATAGTLFTENAKKGADALQLQISALERLRKALDDAGLDSTAVTEKLIPLKIKLTLRDAAKNSLSKEEVDLQVQALNNELNEAFQKQAIRLESIKVKPQRIELAELPSGNIDSAVAKASGFDKKIPAITIPSIRINLLGFELGNAVNKAEELRERLKETLIQGLFQGSQDAADAFGSAIGEIFSTGTIGSGLAKFGESILSIIGGILQQLGTQIVFASGLMEALKQVLTTVGLGGASLAIGLGLIAGGALLKNIKFNVPKFAEGGIATGPTLGIFGEAGKEAIIPLDRLPELMGNVNAAQPALVLQPSIRFEGADFRIMLQQVDQRRGRIG